MIEDIISFFKNKKVLILGFGREGESTYKFIRKYLEEQKLYIADKDTSIIEKYKYLNLDKNVEIITGDSYLNGIEEYDIIMKAPGISFKGMDISKFKNKINSQCELLLKYCSNLVIGITGTKGKSTTSSLVYKVIKDQGKEALLLGNIGTPIFSYLDLIASNKNIILVLELSAHQLEFMEESPNISILLNFAEEHLDHYNSYEDYINAKCNIFKYQDEKDYLIYNMDDSIINRKVSEIKPNSNLIKVSFSNNINADIMYKNEKIYVESKEVYNSNDERKLIGDYNLNNIMFVLGVASILNLDKEKVRESINNFCPLAHRLEYVGTYNGTSFYDNSIGTVPISTIEAIKALKNVDILIIGGMDRGIDYTDFINYLNSSSITNIICMPDTGFEIAKHLKNKNVVKVNSMHEAVESAKKLSRPNISCLLSPAAASYGYFKNFEEKGDLFKRAVNGEIIDK